MSQEITINIGNAEIKPSLVVRNLGGMLDSKIDKEQHINYVCRSCHGQIRQIGHIRKFLTSDATKMLVNYFSAGSKNAKIWARSTQRITADFL